MLGPSAFSSMVWPILWLTVMVSDGVVLALALRGRRRPGPHCPACGYDMEAIGGTRCPECGRESASREALVHRRRHPWVAATMAMALLACGFLFGRAAWRSGWQYALLPPWKLVLREQTGPFAVELLEARDPNAPTFGRRVRVLRDGEVLFVLDGFYFELGTRIWKDGRPTEGRELVGNLTGDGRAEMAITTSTGGSGGDSATLLFSLDPVSSTASGGFTPIAVLPFPGRFEDVEGDGVREFVCGDNTYRYRWTSGAESPQPKVVLRWDGRRFVVDVDAMRRGAVDSRGGASASGPPTPGTVLRRVLDLVYQGRGDEGLCELRSRVEDSAPATAATLGKALDELPGAIRESPFRQELLVLNADQREFMSWITQSTPRGGPPGPPR